MNDFDPTGPSTLELFRDANETVKQALRNPEYTEYAYKAGPLTLDQLSDNELLQISDVVEKYGWPSYDDDDEIAPTREYSDAKFLDNFFEHPSSFDNDEINEEALNNFMQYLRSAPISEMSQVRSTEDFYGFNPVVHRANALAPDLFGALRQATRCFVMSEHSYAKAFLGQDENKDMVTALNMAYQIMGRLLKKDDLSIPVTDAHKTLTA